jgi:hypothetical protein
MSSTGQAVGGIVGAVVGYYTGIGPVAGAQIGMTIGGLLDPPKGPTVVGPRLSDLSVQTSSYGVPLARVYGTVPIVGNIFWLENNQIKETVKKKKQGGKGGPSSTVKTYSYSATFAVALADCSKTGPVAGIRRIWLGSVLWYNAGSDDLETIIASNKNAEGFRLYLGTADQMPDPRMQADIGVDDCPAYRNTAYIVFEDLQLEKWSNSLQAAQVKVEIVSSPDISIYQFESIDLSNSRINDYHQILVSDPLAQAIDIGRGTFYITATDSGITAQQRATTLGGREITTEETPLAGSFRGLYIKQDGSNTAVSGAYAISYEFQKIGDYYYQYHADRVTQKEDITVQFSATELYIPQQLDFPVEDVVAPLFTAVPAGSDSYVDVDIYNGEIYALVFSSASSTIYINVYDQTLTLNRTINSSYLNSMISAAIADTAIFVTDIEICIYSGEVEHKFVFIGHLGEEIESITLPPFSLGTVGKTGVRDGMAISGRFVWMWNSSDQLMLIFNLAMFNSAMVPLSDVVRSEMQIAGIIEATDIDVSGLMDAVRGYRIAGGSIRGALAPLQGAYPFDAIPSGYQIKCVPRGQSSIALVPIADFGAASGTEMADVVLDGPSREMDTQLPRKVVIKHLDSDRDYDINEQAFERDATDSVDIETNDLPIVLTVNQAAGVAQSLLYLRWLERDGYQFSLPPIYSDFEPADVIDIETEFGQIPLRIVEINYGADGVLKGSAKPNSPAVYEKVAIGGQGSTPNGTIGFSGDSTLLFLDIPLMRSDLNEPGFIAMMAGETEGWPGGVAFRSNDNGQTFDDVQSFAGPGTFGIARNALGANAGHLIDRNSTFIADWMAGEPESVTEDQILAGYNYYAYGADGRWEIIAIADFDLHIDGSYICSIFLRGLKGTEWATALHQGGDYLVLLDDPDNAFIGAGYDSFGVEKIWRGVTNGQDIDEAPNQSFAYQGVNLTPLSPVNIQGDIMVGTWSITWDRRSRLAGSIWTTGVELPLGETTERYEVDIMNGLAAIRTISVTSPAASYTYDQQLADFGVDQSAITVNIYQLSETIGRGYAGRATLVASTSTATLLLHFDGANGSTTFTDSAVPPHTLTAFGNAQISTAQSKFGGASGLFDATGDYLTAPHSGDFSILGDFTIECFVRRTASGRDTIASKYTGTSNGFAFSVGATDLLSMTLGTGSYISAISAATVPVGSWVHVAASKQGSTLRVFIDGVLGGTLAITGTVADSSSDLYIGREPLDTSRDFGGYMDEFRFVRGIAIYTATFTPPAAPFA